MRDHIDFCKKRLLVLGGTAASYDVVRLAQEMGAYVIVTDEAETEKRISKQIANETASVSTDDIPELSKLIKEKNIDSVFCGPSEFNIKNMIDLCSENGIRCYATPDNWELCSNKETFKDYCRRYDVPTAKEYSIEMFSEKKSDKGVEYPLIVKPVDACSSVGISICNTKQEVIDAYQYAISKSKSRHAIIEQYIDNGGKIFNFRYLINEGKCIPYLTFDTYIADPIRKKCLVSAFTYFPSDLTCTFLNSIDQNARKMISSMGLKNGVAFIQSIPLKGKIYCHEMGFRLSGGMIYKITEPLMGINDMRMMLRYAMGGPIAYDSDIIRIKLNSQGCVYGQLMIPLESDTIRSIEGLDELLNIPNVVDFLQYYKKGDTVPPELYGTLGQHFGRFTLKADNKKQIIEVVEKIQSRLKIQGEEYEDMYLMKFDTARLMVD